MQESSLDTFVERLHSGKILLGDGAMGTELQIRGLPAGTCPEEYNVINPETVQSIHRDYIEAGSDMIETNTFGGNRCRLKLHDFEHRVEEFNRRAAELACEICPPGKFVGGSIGPTGEIIEPLGPRSRQEAYDIFAEQVEALADGGVHVIYVETMMAPEEAEIAIRAVKEKTALPVIATMTFEAGKVGLRTMWGITVADAVQRLRDAGADVIGANCGRGPDEMLAVMREMRPLTDQPIIAQSNAGLPEWIGGVPHYKTTPEIIAAYVEQLLQEGVNILGGCCGTGPDHIRIMRSLIDHENAKDGQGRL